MSKGTDEYLEGMKEAQTIREFESALYYALNAGLYDEFLYTTDYLQMACAKKNNKFGLVKLVGMDNNRPPRFSERIPVIYDEITEPGSIYLAVRHNDKWGLFYRYNGEQVKPFEYDKEDILKFMK